MPTRVLQYRVLNFWHEARPAWVALARDAPVTFTLAQWAGATDGRTSCRSVSENVTLSRLDESKLQSSRRWIPI